MYLAPPGVNDFPNLLAIPRRTLFSSLPRDAAQERTDIGGGDVFAIGELQSVD